ncbi:uncharacterized [Tachysurus ichikawai]
MLLTDNKCFPQRIILLSVRENGYLRPLSRDTTDFLIIPPDSLTRNSETTRELQGGGDIRALTQRHHGCSSTFSSVQ